MNLQKPIHFVDNDGMKHTFYCEVCTYVDGSLAIELYEFCDEDYPEPYLPLTVNLDGWTGRKDQSATRAFLNVNDYGVGVRRLVEETGIAQPVGLTIQSGYVEYPLYEFDLEKIA